MKINRKHLQRFILNEVTAMVTEKKGPDGLGQKCAKLEGGEGCVRKSTGGKYGAVGTWYILDNKDGGIFRKGFKSKRKALAALSVPGVHETVEIKEELRKAAENPFGTGMEELDTDDPEAEEIIGHT